MANTAISVPCAGDKLYNRALKVVSGRHGIRMADVVRKALDTSEYAIEIQRELTSFFADNAASTQHSGDIAELESA